jgi:hypothetical protein
VESEVGSTSLEHREVVKVGDLSMEPSPHRLLLFFHKDEASPSAGRGEGERGWRRVGTKASWTGGLLGRISMLLVCIALNLSARLCDFFCCSVCLLRRNHTQVESIRLKSVLMRTTGKREPRVIET